MHTHTDPVQDEKGAPLLQATTRLSSMSHVAYDIQWEEAMQDLLKIFEMENSSSPKGMLEYSIMYVRYLQVYRKIEECYDQVVHAQKCIDLRKALEICIGRLLELRSWMSSLNEGSDSICFDEALKTLNLGPDALEVPHPRFMVDDNIGLLQNRENILTAIVDKKADEVVVETTIPIMTIEEAIEILQANERGRQSRCRIRELAKIRKMQEEEIQHKHSGAEARSTDSAARTIQAVCHIRNMEKEELKLLGMDNFCSIEGREKANALIRSIHERRKEIRALNKSNFDEAVVFAKEKVKELEGQEMREIIQDKINSWLLKNREPETGHYPPFPKEDEGGSKYILNPPPKMDFFEEVKEKKNIGKDSDKKSKRTQASMLNKVPMPKPDEGKPPSCPVFFRNHLFKIMQAYNDIWHDKDDSSNFTQKYDAEILKSSLQPCIFEEVRTEVDRDTRTILDGIKKKILAQEKSQQKKTDKKGSSGKSGKSKKAEENIPKFTILDMGDNINKKPPKDKTAQRTLDSIFNELAESGIVQNCPDRSFSDFVCADTMDSRKDGKCETDPSFAQAKRLVIEYCVLPLASDFVHEHAPYHKSVLLYGGPSNGKTLLVHATCRAAGATFINLSPRNIEGKYPGSQAGKMVQMAFKIAKIMAPSIVYVDEVEMLFIKDKKKLKAYGLKDKPGRIKSSLIKEMSALKAGDRVLIIGTSSAPQDTPAKPPNLVSLFSKTIYVPYPDHASRVHMWRTFLEMHGVSLLHDFNLSSLAHLAQGFSPGGIQQICKEVLKKKRLRKLHYHPLQLDELLAHFYAITPLDSIIHETIRNWGKPEPSGEARKQVPQSKSPIKK